MKRAPTGQTMNETIAAIGTPPGAGGIAVVRVSGPGTLALADRVFRGRGLPPSQRKGQSFLYGHVHHDGHDIDEVLLLIMRAPHSYTCEDMIEIQGHGGRVMAKRILRCLLDCGTRLAEPGEFTRRAFLNGRLDLLQAEAVLDIIHARTNRSAQAALEQLEGNLSSRFEALYNKVLETAADLEAMLDFPEEDLPLPNLEAIPMRLQGTLNLVDALIDESDEGHLLREGAVLVISGPANAGKSTLLNHLVGRNRAIVSPQPGTTRDTIEEEIVIDGIPVRVIDTAGLRSTVCEIEQEGIMRSEDEIKRADIHLFVIDSSEPLTSSLRKRINEEFVPNKTLILLNKSDRAQEITREDLPNHECLETCLLDDSNLAELRHHIQRHLESGIDFSVPPHAVISERHRQLLLSAKTEIEQAEQLLLANPEGNMVPAATHLRSALESLGAVTGRVYGEELLDNIFSRFCIGK